VIDEITETWVAGEHRKAEEQKKLSATRSAFSAEFTRRFEGDVRPAMEGILDRLRRDGGGGAIVERPEDQSRLFSHRFTLWMSLSGEIEGNPRQDRHAYLQLDANVDGSVVGVSEGDLWRNRPQGSSGKVADWTLEEMDAGHVDQEAIAILRRSAGEGR
jgi:hypothetical protein